MPRKTDPGAIRIGSGKTVPSPTTVRLNGTIPPNIGTVPGADTTGDSSSVETRHLFSDLFSSWVLEGGQVSSVDAGATIQVSWTTLTILYKGQRISLPAGTTSFPDVTPYHKYVYVSATPETGTGRHPVLLTDDLPLITGDVSAHHILLGLVSNDGTGRVTTDLRDILTDVDQRENLYVGNGEGTEAFTPHFTTLASAVAYVNEMQSPTSGDPGRRFHIQIVGYTNEADAALPIKIKTPGLMITGSPRMRSGTEKVEVCWSAPGKALIDFNGQPDTVVRDVSFRCTLDETLYPPGNPQRDRGSADRVLFINTSTTACYRVCVENCRLSGPAQGFLYVFSGTLSGFINSKFVHNYGTKLLDFGICLSTVATAETYCQIRENTFEMDMVHPGAIYAGKYLGGIYLGVSPAKYARVEDNVITGFATGINIVGGFSASVRGNYITQTLNEGLKFTGTGDITDNRIFSVYTGVPAVRRQGLAATGFIGMVGRNLVTLTMTAATDYEIVVSGSSACLIDGNYGSQTEVNCIGSTILTHGDSLLTVLSSNCILSGCNIATVNLIGNSSSVSDSNITTLNAGSSSTGTLVSSGHSIQGSRIDTLYLGENCKVSDSTITTLYATSRDKIHSNVITSLRDYTAIVTTRVIEDAIIEGNAITETVTLACTKLHFKGNKLQGNATSDSSLMMDSAVGSGVTPSDHIIEGNYIEGIVSCGAAISGAARSRFINNQIGDRGADTNLFKGDDVLVSGNTFLSDSSILGDRVRVDANNATGKFFSLSGAGAIKFITNNYAASITVSEGGVISGNILSGNLSFHTDATGCIIIGNIIGGNLGAAGDESDAITMGNRVTGTIYGAGPVAGGPKSSEVAVAGTSFNIS